MFRESFFFSAQTLSTVGFEGMAPIGFWTQIFTAIESLVGTVMFAILTGLIYGRYSKPKSNIRFSANILVSPFKEGQGLMFRLANATQNKLTSVHIKLLYTYQENGKNVFKYLNLDFDRIDFFPVSWTVVHPIDDNSPLKDIHALQLADKKVEFIINLEFYDNTYSTQMHVFHSYKNGMKWYVMLDLSLVFFHHKMGKVQTYILTRLAHTPSCSSRCIPYHLTQKGASRSSAITPYN